MTRVELSWTKVDVENPLMPESSDVEDLAEARPSLAESILCLSAETDR